ncbi:SusC/RagA family TonB-linked outer membrane protein [Elizabethkingia meningoseptica]|uniref:SusC/RagA family TonB-linked outer membrane protein n=1 Tax=Elizabethkingia meningoseptica TaxID=238 RepID=UPI002011CBA8|nr:SusC/RagA family TonB-linked outer membrane protein [Elizabethkingia meningoseptica]MCL1676741.1 SusC/RagA family TonB-linked outer membrane protein [Elizabethkingia meningoseptica]MCL1686654.1 SusC/RagA family TonB-linked outer membrane protein [Elizabethkingia meningoseptica]
MNVKLRVLSAGVLFFIGQGVMAQKIKKDTSSVKDIDEVVVVGYGVKSAKKITTSVSKVKADELIKVSAASADALLQGATTGLQVSPTSGAPGAGFNVRLRGVSSITSSNDPLYVVDGVPVSSNSPAGTTSYGGQTSSLLSQLNLADVESLEVLKDAAAAAIYGSRAANGVVLITTKKGKKGRTNFSFNSTIGFQNPIKKFEKMKAGAYYKMLDLAEFNTNPGRGKTYWSLVNKVWDPGSGQSIDDFYNSDFGDDYLKHIYKKDQPISELSVSASGGNDKTSYYVGFSNFDQMGVIKGQEYSRQTFTLNLDQKLNDIFKVLSSVRLSNEYNARINGDNNIYAPLTTAILEPPGQFIWNPNGDYNTDTWSFSNPLQSATDVKGLTKIFGVNASLGLESKFSSKLNMVTRFNLERINYDESRLFPLDTYQGRGSKGQADYNGRLYNTFTAFNTLTYTEKISDWFRFTLMGGMEYFNRKTTVTDIQTQNLPLGATSPNAGSEKIIASYYPSLGNRTFSYFSRLSLEIFNNLFVDATFRADSSSKLAYDNRTEYFPSVSAAYVISDNKWFKNNTVNFLKFKAGWGELGNQSGLGNFETSPYAKTYAYGLLPAVNVAPLYGSGVPLSNAALKWERTAQTDAGVEIGLFNNRINIVYDFYNKKSRQLLLNATSALENGAETYKSNAAEMYNRGHEVGVNAAILKGVNFKWNSQFNITFNKNEVTKLIGDTPVPVDFGFVTRIDVGQPVGAFFGFRANGIYRSNDEIPKNLYDQGIRPGDVRYEDVNGDGVINSDDRVFIGKAQPDFFGNFRNTWKVKNFDLSANIIFVFGQDMYNSSLRFAGISGNPLFGKFANQTGYWTADNSNSDLPRPVRGFAQSWNNQASSRFIENASYIRLREVQLGYTLPKSMLNVGDMTLRFFIAADNLWTWTNYSGPEPEVNAFGQANVATGTDFFTQGMNKVIKFGINLNF